MVEETNRKPYGLGLALSGGGAKGFAHLGVFRLLEECGVMPDIIAGTSVGALMGALFADGYSSAEIQALFTGREFSEFARLQIPKTGIFDSRRFRQFLERSFRARNIEDLRIPMVIVATDLDHGVSHEFREGPIVEAVTASCSIPIIFKPVKINGTNYVDGGVLRNLPASTIRDKCDFLIGVNVSPIPHAKYKSTIIDIASRTYDMMSKSNATKDIGLCDVVIQTDDIASYNVFNIKPMKEIIKSGYYEALKVFKENNITNNLI